MQERVHYLGVRKCTKILDIKMKLVISIKSTLAENKNAINKKNTEVIARRVIPADNVASGCPTLNVVQDIEFLYGPDKVAVTSYVPPFCCIDKICNIRAIYREYRNLRLNWFNNWVR
jgi:hypothetical protein